MSAGRIEQRMTRYPLSPETLGMWRARTHEALIYLASHPLAVCLAWAFRRMGRIVHIPALGYIVNDAVLMREVLADEEHFSKSGPGSVGALITPIMGDSALINMNGEAHRALKGRLRGLFTPAYVDLLGKAAVDDLTAELHDRLAGGETVDLVRFVHLMTGRVMCHMLGIRLEPGREEDMCLEIFELGARLVSILRLSTKRLPPKQIERSRRIFDQLIDHARAAYQRSDDTDSVLGRLRDMGLSFEEARGVIVILLLAGTETVSTALPRIVALLADTGLWATLRTHPELLQPSIDEGLRYTMPSPIILRSVASTVVVGGHRLRAGERVIVFTYNAVRDGRHTRRPRLFDIRRDPDPVTRHLWFGAGQHFCLGYALAQRELRGVIGPLLQLPADLEIVRRSYARRVLFPAYSRLEVRLQA